MILLIIGTSSSGKTFLSHRLQEVLPDFWQYMSLDSVFAGIPDRYGGGVNGPLSEVGFAYANKEVSASITYGSIGQKVLRGMISSAIAMEAAGINVIFDDMIIDKNHSKMWEAALEDVESVIVRLNASESVLEARNTKRPNPPKLALNHIETNASLDAEMEIDTGTVSVDSAARMIAEKLADKAVHQTS